MKLDVGCVAGAAWVLLLARVILAPSVAEAGGPDRLAATGSRHARHEAINAIPWQALSPADRPRVEQVVKNATLYRRLPTRVIDCDPEVFNFLGQHPEVVTELWKMMGVCDLDLERIGSDLYRVTDSAGTTGTMQFLAATWGNEACNRVLVYAEGAYHGAPFPRSVGARSVLLLRSGSTVETNGRPYVTARLDSFILVDRLAIELVTKTVQPLITKTADHNFIETMKFVSTFSKTAEENPSGMQRLAHKLENVSPPVRSAMAEVCLAAAARYRHLSTTQPSDAVRLARRVAPLPQAETGPLAR